MRSELIFDLPEDSYEHWAALNGTGLLRILDDLDRKLRDFVKHDINFQMEGEPPICKDCDPQDLAEAIRYWIGAERTSIGDPTR